MDVTPYLIVCTEYPNVKYVHEKVNQERICLRHRLLGQKR